MTDLSGLLSSGGPLCKKLDKGGLMCYYTQDAPVV